MKRFTRTLPLAAVLSLFVSVGAFAQLGTVTGVVVDDASGETLIGVNVQIEGTFTGTSTDLDGRYTIANLQPGLYNLIFSYIGFAQQTVQNVEIHSDRLTRLDVVLSEETEFLDEVVVEARSIRNNEAALLKDRQKAFAVSDAISSEAISRSGGSNAADAMSKVTGASVVGGKYVYVRGLGERYASTHMNGVEMPTADPDKKAVQFDLFPANLVENIVTLKTFTPDKPGNFSGGLVDIGTKSFPEELDIRLSISSAVNSETHFGSDFIAGPTGNLDWLAIDDGLRSLPNVLDQADLVIPSAARARRDAELAQQLDAVSKSFNSVMAPLAATAPMNYSYSFSVGNQKNLVSRPLGFVVGLTYGRNSSYYEGGTTGRYSFSGTQLNSDLLLADKQGSQEVSWGGIANLTYQFAQTHELGLNTMYTRAGESSARLQVGTWPKELGDDPNSIRTNRYLAYTEREVYSGQLRGKHYLPGLLKTTIEWTGAYARTLQDEPDRRYFASTERVIGSNTVLSASSSGFQDPSRYFRRLEEDSYNGKLDISIPFKQWAGQSAKIKLGGALQQANRDFAERIFAVRPSAAVTFTGDEAAFFSQENMGIVAFDTTRGTYTFGNVIADDSKQRNNYTGERMIDAGYAMLEVPLVGGLKMVGGIRVERTDISVTSADTTLDVGRIEETDLLPSVNLVYALSDQVNVRAAATKTLARPTFREIAPFASFDFTAGDFRIGNPNLERTSITNYDVRVEYFPGVGEIVAVSGFYKDLENPIEEAIIGGTNGQLQYQNVGHATVLGLEVELRKSLAFVSGALAPFAVGVNSSFVTSKVDVPETELETRRAINPDASSTRELQGQSPYLVNADLSYTNIQSGTNVGVYFNVFGRRLSNVSLGGTPDVFERPRPVLDMTFSQSLRSRWTIKASAKNLLDSPFRQTHRFEGEDYVYQEYRYGRSFSLGFSFTN